MSTKEPGQDPELEEPADSPEPEESAQKPEGNNQENETQASSQPAKNSSKIRVLLISAIVVVLLFSLFKWKKAADRAALIDAVQAKIKVHAEEARERNSKALKSFEMEAKRLSKLHEQKLADAAKDAAMATAKHESCLMLLALMAMDQVRNQNRTQSHLEKMISPRLEPTMKLLDKDADTLMKMLHYELKGSTVQLATNLAALNPDSSPDSALENEGTDHANLEKSLRKLGFKKAGAAAFAVFDVGAIYNSSLAARLGTMLNAITTRTFGTQIAKLANSPSLSAAPAAITTPELLAMGAAALALYDLVQTREEFENEIRTSLTQQLTGARNHVYERAFDHAKATVKEYQERQDQMGTQTFEQMTQEID